MSKKRIAFLLTHPIQYISPLLSYLTTSGVLDVFAFYQSNCSVIGYKDKNMGVSIKWDIPLLKDYDYEFLPALGNIEQLTYFRPVSYGLAEKLNAYRPDVLIIHGYNRPFHWSAMRIAYKLGIPVFIRDDSNLICRERSKVNILLKKFFFSFINRYVTGYLAVGKANHDYYLHHGIEEDNIIDVPWAVDNEFFRSRAIAAKNRLPQMQKDLGIKPGAPVILFIGKLLEAKGVIGLLDAFKKVSEKVPEAYLLLVGDGELRAMINARLSSNPQIIAAGFRNQMELPMFYALSDVFVLPSNNETWGLVVNEAMAVGKPVIVSDRVGCWPDLIEVGVNGYVFPAGNVSALTSVLLRCLSDRAQLNEMGYASSKRIAVYDYKSNLNGFLKALKFNDHKGLQRQKRLNAPKLKIAK